MGVAALVALLPRPPLAAAEDAPAPPHPIQAADEPPAPVGLNATVPVGVERDPEAEQPGPSTLRDLPLESRIDLLRYVGLHVPGVALVSGGLSIRGAHPHETALYLDGVRVSRLVLPLLMIEDLDVLTAGYGARLADVSGGAVAAGTRRESNRLRVDLGTFSELRDRRRDVATAALSGPLWADRLFGSLAFQFEGTKRPSVEDPEGIFPDTPDITRDVLSGGAKLTWLPRAGQRLELLAAGRWQQQDNTPVLGVVEAAQPHFSEDDYQLSARWLGRLAARLQGRAQLHLERHGADEEPRNCSRPTPGQDCQSLQVMVQKVPRTQWLGNWRQTSHSRARALEAVGGLELSVLERAASAARLSLTSRLRASDRSSELGVPGNNIIELNGPVFEAQTVYYANDPRLEEGRPGAAVLTGTALRTVHTLEAPLRLSRVYLTPGVSLVTARAGIDRGATVDDLALGHAVSLAWQVTGRPALWVRAGSYGRVDADLEWAVGQTGVAPVRRRCRWDEASAQFSRECEFSGGDAPTIGLPCGPLGFDDRGRPCREQLRLPRVWEHTVGAGLELPWGLWLDLDVVDRRMRDPWSTTETNRRWSNAGTLDPMGAYRNGRPQTVANLSTMAGAAGSHRAYVTTLARRAGRLRLALSHSHERNRRVGYLTASGLGELVAPAGARLEADDRGRHFAYLQATFDVMGDVSFGALYGYAQGPVYLGGRIFEPDIGGTDLRSGVGANPGTNVNDPADDRPLRLASQQQLHLQMRVRGRRLLRADVDLYLDVLDVMSERRPVVTDELSFAPADGPSYWFRLGAEYRY